MNTFSTVRAVGACVVQIIQKYKFSTVNAGKNIFSPTVNQTFTKTCCIKKIGTMTVGKFSSVANEANIFSKNEMLHIQTEIGRYSRYPWLWLRDNCQCKLCFNPQMHSRTIDWKYFDIGIHPTSFTKNSDRVDITWSDGHKSQFTLKWLQEREFITDVQEKWLKSIYRLQRISWNADTFPEILRKFKYNDLITSDEYLLMWLKSLATFGIAVIEDTPHREDQLQKLANRVAFIKKTHYGEEFVVRNKPDTTNLAYLAIPLQMHTDMPYYEYKPGVNMLHCLEQTSEGGENQFTDCFYVSQFLKEKDPEIYKILSTTPVDWSDIGEEKGQRFHSLYRAPVICENEHGEFVRVNYNQWQRDSHFTVPLDEAKFWYKANAIFTQALYDKHNMVQFKTKPGEIVTFDNIRLVHGRSGYTDSADNHRHIIGSYLDWDVVFSRIRVLQKYLK